MKIECKSETGITVSLVDGILTMSSLLSTRNLNSPEVKEAIKDLKEDPDLGKLLLEDNNKHFHRNPAKYLPLSEAGDQRIQWFMDKYAGLRLLQRLPLFEKAYTLMKERGNISRKKAFGEMHGDNYMWIIEVPEKSYLKVIALEMQSNMILFIKDGGSFHIREVYYPNIFPAYRKHELTFCSLKNFIKTKFRQYEGNEGYVYGDSRDSGYLGSTTLIPGCESIDGANRRILHAIELMDYWEPYLNDPDELE